MARVRRNPYGKLQTSDTPHYVRTPVTVTSHVENRPIHVVIMQCSASHNAYKVDDVFFTLSEAGQLCDALAAALQDETLSRNPWKGSEGSQ